MKLFKLENSEKVIWYFTNTAKASKFLDTAQSYLDACRKNNKTCKGWSIEEIEDDNILSKYINPERKYI